MSSGQIDMKTTLGKLSGLFLLYSRSIYRSLSSPFRSNTIHGPFLPLAHVLVAIQIAILPLRSYRSMLIMTEGKKFLGGIRGGFGGVRGPKI